MIEGNGLAQRRFRGQPYLARQPQPVGGLAPALLGRTDPADQRGIVGGPAGPRGGFEQRQIGVRRPLARRRGEELAQPLAQDVETDRVKFAPAIGQATCLRQEIGDVGRAEGLPRLLDRRQTLRPARLALQNQPNP